ncbi:hypothetical protein I6U48_03975 [Clostridium sp. PL3]|uniref:Uncharacterized protein n=1 Tax=Clostridium thailandense TaxID=2794346 RepID=A0A949WQ10_9CLOT|nr:L-2-amino-thiazoline-4-carboxylic acid hydrolase [Clostridium thailandense]MBV7272075.1 hypothetical protein [Clostridium thailandense]
MRKIGLYEISIVVFFALLPIVGISNDIFILKSRTNISNLMFKWFVFSGVGLRLLSAGLKQAANPSFTAKEIFKVNDEKSFPIVREIGFANISFGLLGVLSFCFPGFRLAAAISGGLYFGLAGCLHLFSKKRSKDEFSKLGMPELTAIMCAIDNVIFNAYLPDTVFFHRKGSGNTIIAREEYCTFVCENRG